ncbi:SigE family RNA polymerase sigma factor [Phytomonospora endophytica]|uniref:RNA polymerase sigma-70 factor (Sigma-E family) n=1 Tax=Phytomonospora endophytica TaxID=714109 RepID=A0A841FCL5_9ACTN|nr:SigE family RNA polymerase sigma factor [Phytomonospora endophytica]MBB6034006.1 RNA polymerase sigma-70 factor (sigma-E family) [Phytomonospora endophytica]GIG64473.1 RNA polymerase sigma24 factor [Phytomonospora endophytica]
MTPEQESDFEEYVAAQSKRLCRFAYLCCADWHQAEDVVQTALIRLYGAWARSTRSSVDAYVRKIIVNALIDERRLFRFRREQTRDELPENPQRPAGLPEERVVLIDALLRLPKRQRAAVVLRYWEDLPGEQVARVLGCSNGAARNLTMRGLAGLRELLSAEALELFEGVPS